MTRLIEVPYAVRPAEMPDTPYHRLVGTVLGLNGQPVRIYEVRRRRGLRRHDGRLRKRVRA